MKIKTIAYALSLIFLSSCGGSSSSDTNIVDPVTNKEVSVNTAKKTLDDNKEKWALKNIKSYQYQYSVGCFCMEEMMMNKQVTVSNGVTTEAFFLQTSEYLTPEQLTRVKNVGELFDVVEQAINLKADKLSVTYNKDYGYPETISIDYNTKAVDDEITYYAHDLM